MLILKTQDADCNARDDDVDNSEKQTNGWNGLYSDCNGSSDGDDRAHN